MQGTLRTKRIDDETVVEKWRTVVEGAAGNGDAIFTFIVEKLETLAVPNIIVARQTIKPLRNGISREQREFLVIKNTKIDNYDIYISAYDYGNQLFVSWYMLKEKDDFMKLLKKRPIRTLLFFPFIALSWVFIALRGTHSMLNDGSASGFNPQGALGFDFSHNLFDQEEISAYAASVHGAAKDAIEELAKATDFDFAKVDTHTRGFLNLS